MRYQKQCPKNVVKNMLSKKTCCQKHAVQEEKEAGDHRADCLWHIVQECRHIVFNLAHVSLAKSLTGVLPIDRVLAYIVFTLSGSSRIVRKWVRGKQEHDLVGQRATAILHKAGYIYQVMLKKDKDEPHNLTS